MGREISYTEIGLWCIAGGTIIGNWFGSPWGVVLHGAGIGSALYGVYRKSNKTEKLFEVLGLCTGRDNKQYPKIMARRKTSYGECVELIAPLGLCSEDFRKKEIALIEYFDAKEVKINYSNGRIYLQLYKNELKSVYNYDEDIETKGILEVPVAYDTSGVVLLDILAGPHVLVAGETGSGKSTTLRNIITYLIQHKARYGVKLHLIDLKEGAEFNIFMRSTAVKSFAKDNADAERILKNLLREVRNRYKILFKTDCVDIEEYNRKNKNNRLNYEVCIIDEFADLQYEKESLRLLEELLAKSRACGIRFVISTQRPDRKVLNGRLKANVPFIIGLKAMNGVNSRIIIDQDGLENLRGKGHALIKTTRIVEAQCIQITTERARGIVRATYKEKAPEKADFVPHGRKENQEIKDFGFLKLLSGGKND